MDVYFDYLIIGGGIGGVTCVETLNQLEETLTIGLINYSDNVKAVTNLHKVTNLIENFNVVDRDFVDISNNNSRLFMIKGEAALINSVEKFVKLKDDRKIFFSKLCICTGAKPKLIYDNNDFIIGIRDTDSVEIFKEKLAGCKRVAIIGNGGIATELIYELADCELVWIIKDKNISATFFDSAAGKFLLNSFDDNEKKENKGAEKISIQRHHYDIDGTVYTTERKIIETEKSQFGGALGPDWAQQITMRGCGNKKLEVRYEAEIAFIESEPDKVAEIWNSLNSTNQKCDFKVALTLTNGSIEFCDLVISATGVTPAFPPLIDQKWSISDTDGGILVKETMETNIDGIYAAGDCCSANWEHADNWFQMRLWNQARLMGFQAAKSMFTSQHNKSPMLDAGFELFTHVTKFFGYSVILLGLYNGQKLKLENNENAELLIRISPGLEYIKCVVVNGRIRGAILIGDTDMAETLENLILNEIDISQFGEKLLDPEIDIDDFFD